MNASKSASHKTIKLNEDELAFLMDYRRLEDLEREKGIKREREKESECVCMQTSGLVVELTLAVTRK